MKSLTQTDLELIWWYLQTRKKQIYADKIELQKQYAVPSDLKQIVARVQASLKEKDWVILVKYSTTAMTLDNIGMELGVTKERVRQLLNRAYYNGKKQVESLCR